MLVIPNRVSVVAAMSALGLAVGLLTLALLAKPAHAQPDEMVNERLPIATAIVNPCTDEVVFIEGTQHFIFFTHEDATGGDHTKGQIILQATGVSDSGAKYVVHNSAIAEDNFRVFSESAITFIFTGTTIFIRQGSDTPTDNFVLIEVTHVTVNANGEVTSVVNQFEAECQGMAG